MSLDRDLRALERAAAQGDPDAELQLAEARIRVGEDTGQVRWWALGRLTLSRRAWRNGSRALPRGSWHLPRVDGQMLCWPGGTKRRLGAACWVRHADVDAHAGLCKRCQATWRASAWADWREVWEDGVAWALTLASPSLGGLYPDGTQRISGAIEAARRRLAKAAPSVTLAPETRVLLAQLDALSEHRRRVEAELGLGGGL